MGMKRIAKPTLVLLLALVTWPGTGQAAFEDVEVSPRIRALGGAYAATQHDPYAPFHNPASLAFALSPQVAASYVRPFGYDFSSQSVISTSTGRRSPNANRASLTSTVICFISSSVNSHPHSSNFPSTT